MSLDRFKNIEQVEGRTPVYGETYLQNHLLKQFH